MNVGFADGSSEDGYSWRKYGQNPQPTRRLPLSGTHLIYDILGEDSRQADLNLLERYCVDCARIGSTDCIDHGGRLSEDTSVLGKRLGGEFFRDFRETIRVSKIQKPVTNAIEAAPSAPTTKFAVLPDTDPNTPSDQSREQVAAEKLQQYNYESNCKKGRVRFREDLGKYMVECRPRRFKWTFWMGTYASVDEGRRAYDCVSFYTGQDKGGFYFKDSPALFAELGPLNRPFALVSKDIKDKAFIVERKKRAEQVIRKDKDAQSSDQSCLTSPIPFDGSSPTAPGLNALPASRRSNMVKPLPVSRKGSLARFLSSSTRLRDRNNDPNTSKIFPKGRPRSEAGVKQESVPSRPPVSLYQHLPKNVRSTFIQQLSPSQSDLVQSSHWTHQTHQTQ